MPPMDKPVTPSSRPQTNSKSKSNTPPSRLSTSLNVKGSAPPTAESPRSAGPPATSSGRIATGSRTAAGYENLSISLLAAELIKQMRIKFGEAACNVKGQEIITQEVMVLVNQTSKMKEDDISALQQRIRNRLTGEPAAMNSMAKEKRSQVEKDEWGRVFQYQAERGNQEDILKAQAQAETDRRLKEVLELQIQEHQLRKATLQEQEQKYHQAQQQSLKEWEAKEAAHKQKLQEISDKVKAERELQLQDKTARTQLAITRRVEEESTLARRIAYDTRSEAEKEEAAKAAAKAQYCESMAMNVVYLKQRQEEKARQAEEDLKYKDLWEKKLNKQEADRISHRDKILERQKKQLELLRTRPASRNRWVDQSVIDKQYAESEAAKDAEEIRRQNKVKEGNELMKGKLVEQVQEKNQLRQLQRQEEEEKARALLAKVAAEEAAEKERQRVALEKKMRFRSDLEAQMRENALRRGEAPMSHTERLLNTQLLVDVEKFETTGKIVLPLLK